MNGSKMQKEYDELMVVLGKAQGKIRELGLQNIRSKLPTDPDLRRTYDLVLVEMRKTHRNLIKVDQLLDELFCYIED